MQSSLDSKAYDGKVAQGIGQIAAYSTQAWIPAKIPDKIPAKK